MNREKRKLLIEKIKNIGDPNGEGFPLVSIEDFFEGNEDLGSIGCNLLDHPGLNRFQQVLTTIRNRVQVSDVLIGIYEVEESDETMWPFSETVYIVTSVAPDQVFEWLQPLQPDSVAPVMNPILNEPVVPEGYLVCEVWWD